MGERVVIDAFLEVSIPLLMVLLSPLMDSISNQVVWLFEVKAPLAELYLTGTTVLTFLLMSL